MKQCDNVDQHLTFFDDLTKSLASENPRQKLLIKEVGVSQVSRVGRFD
jgi:hypothetical protein